jgi:hypothetical protein
MPWYTGHCILLILSLSMILIFVTDVCGRGRERYTKMHCIAVIILKVILRVGIMSDFYFLLYIFRVTMIFYTKHVLPLWEEKKRACMLFIDHVSGAYYKLSIQNTRKHKTRPLSRQSHTHTLTHTTHTHTHTLSIFSQISCSWRCHLWPSCVILKSHWLLSSSSCFFSHATY